MQLCHVGKKKNDGERVPALATARYRAGSNYFLI
jgi:hypothetical protein